MIPLSGRGRLSVVPRAKYFGAARQLVLARPKSAAKSGGKVSAENLGTSEDFTRRFFFWQPSSDFSGFSDA
ncbi:MAG: hypothetical protein LBP95_06825 [Deltaproteobacteria bacterium]|nr:hypothetical protein [Deltaproteobacteria bacterium]